MFAHSSRDLSPMASREIKSKAIIRKRSQVEQSTSRDVIGEEELDESMLLYVPHTKYLKDDIQNRTFRYELNSFQRIFVFFDDPSSCLLAKINSIFMVVVIIISCSTYVMSTDRSITHRPATCDDPACVAGDRLCPDNDICQPVPPEYFQHIEIICIAFFTLDYSLRVLIVGSMPPRLAGMIPQEFNEAAADEYTKTGVRVADPDWPWYVKFRKYVLQLMNVVDLLAIVPFYLEYLASTGSSIAIIRILRLARMLRIFKASKYNEGTSLLLNTLTRSFSALTLLFFFTAIGVVLFGSLIYFMEAGTFKVTEEYPDGAFLRASLVGEEEEETPFTSILVSCYWVIVTATTVGFGDLYPTSAGGRLVACVCMYCGLLVLALPITVVGSNFASVYEEKEELRELEKQLQEAQQVTEALSNQTQRRTSFAERFIGAAPTPRTRERAFSAPSLSDVSSFGANLEKENREEDEAEAANRAATAAKGLDRRQVFQNLKKPTSSDEEGCHPEDSDAEIEMTTAAKKRELLMKVQAAAKRKKRGSGTAATMAMQVAAAIAEETARSRASSVSTPKSSKKRKTFFRKYIVKVVKIVSNQKSRRRKKLCEYYDSLITPVSSSTTPASATDVLSPQQMFNCCNPTTLSSLIQVSDQLNTVIKFMQSHQQTCSPPHTSAVPAFTGSMTHDCPETTSVSLLPVQNLYDGKPPRPDILLPSPSADTVSDGSRSDHRTTPTGSRKDKFGRSTGGILLRKASSKYDSLGSGSDDGNEDDDERYSL